MKKLHALLSVVVALSTALPALADTTAASSSTASSSSSSSSSDSSKGGCRGKTFNPMSDTDWNNLYPIVIADVPTGTPFPQDPLMFEPAVCVCPGAFGIPSYGVGVTYWQPLYVSEISRRAGCLSSLGGSSVLSSYSALSSEQESPRESAGDVVNRMQVHWYQYPVFGMLDMFESSECRNPAGFDLMWMTEIDPTWQNDEWGIVFSPEAVLFANPIAQAACAVDAVAAAAGYPLDALFWCAGGWGSTYPLTGNASQNNGPFTMNNLVQAKFIARQHREGLMFQTIGPSALCTSHPNPIWIKGQYRVDQVGPVPRYGVPVAIGNPGKLQAPPIANPPGLEHTDNLIWQGMQCCMRTY